MALTVAFGEVPQEFLEPIQEFSRRFRLDPVQNPFKGFAEWDELTQGVEAEEHPWGDVYTLPVNRWCSLGDTALVDFRGARELEVPHKHRPPEVEVYNVLRGRSSTVYAGSRSQVVEVGDTLIMPSGLGHFWSPGGLILAVLNLPDFVEDRQVLATEIDRDPDLDEENRTVAGNWLVQNQRYTVF